MLLIGLAFKMVAVLESSTGLGTIRLICIIFGSHSLWASRGVPASSS